MIFFFISGRFKDVGAEYVRGIAECNGNSPGNNLWVVYSVNKEDLWISRVPIPAEEIVSANIEESFENIPVGEVPEGWDIYQPSWTTIATAAHKGNHYLHIRDEEPYDYAKAVKVFPESKQLSIAFTLLVLQDSPVEIDVLDRYGNRSIRLEEHVSWNYHIASDGPRMRYMKRLF